MGEGGGEAEARMILVSADLELVSMTWKGPAAEHNEHAFVALQ